MQFNRGRKTKNCLRHIPLLWNDSQETLRCNFKIRIYYQEYQEIYDITVYDNVLRFSASPEKSNIRNALKHCVIERYSLRANSRSVMNLAVSHYARVCSNDFRFSKLFYIFCFLRMRATYCRLIFATAYTVQKVHLSNLLWFANDGLRKYIYFPWVPISPIALLVRNMRVANLCVNSC